MTAKKKIEPKATAKKSDRTAAKAARQAARKTGRPFTWSDAGIKHNVTQLG